MKIHQISITLFASCDVTNCQCGFCGNSEAKVDLCDEDKSAADVITFANERLLAVVDILLRTISDVFADGETDTFLAGRLLSAVEISSTIAEWHLVTVEVSFGMSLWQVTVAEM